jgi:hypothetical protein
MFNVTPQWPAKAISLTAENSQCTHRADCREQLLRLLDIGRIVADLLRHLGEDRPAEPLSPLAQVDQNQHRVAAISAQLRRQAQSHVIDGRRTAHNQ